MTNEIKKRVLKTLLIIHITFGAIITPLASLIVLGMEQEIASLTVLVLCIVAYIYFPYRALRAVSANRFYPSIVHSVFTIFCSILMPLGIVQLFLAIKLKNNFTVESAAGVVDVIDMVEAEIPVKLQQTIELSQSSHDSASERKKKKTVYIILAAIKAKAVNNTHALLKGITEKFSKALARPFNKAAIKLVPETSGVYLFFDKRVEKINRNDCRH